MISIPHILAKFYSYHGQEIFSSPELSRPALGPTQPPIQWVAGFFSQGEVAGA